MFEVVVELCEVYGLNDLLLVCYVKWLGGLFIGDVGVLLVNDCLVDVLIGECLSKFLLFVGFIVVFVVLFVMVLGIVLVMYSGSCIDKVVNIFILLMVVVFEFLLVIILVLIFVVEFNWLLLLLYIFCDVMVYDYFRVFVMLVVIFCIVLSV